MVKSRSPRFTVAPSLTWISVMRPETCGWMVTTSGATFLPIWSRYTGTSRWTAVVTDTGAGGRCVWAGWPRAGGWAPSTRLQAVELRDRPGAVPLPRLRGGVDGGLASRARGAAAGDAGDHRVPFAVDRVAGRQQRAQLAGAGCVRGCILRPDVGEAGQVQGPGQGQCGLVRPVVSGESRSVGPMLGEGAGDRRGEREPLRIRLDRKSVV